MADVNVLGILTSARKNGYTAKLFKKAVDILENNGIKVEPIYLHDYKLQPCKSCFYCIKSQQHTCLLEDDFGMHGEGVLYKKVQASNGVFIADPVYSFGSTAMCHLFFERCYPFIWSGKIKGKPIVSISCASNQGMETIAKTDICKLAFSRGFRYLGGIAAHVYRFSEIETELKELFTYFSNHLLNEDNNNSTFSDDEKFTLYMSQPFKPLERFIEYFTLETGDAENSRIKEALQINYNNIDKETYSMLAQAQSELLIAIEKRARGEFHEAIEHLVKVTKLWANSTWRMFLGRELGLTSPPASYKDISQSKDDISDN